MKSRLKTMIATLLAVCFLLSGCAITSGSSQDSSTNSTDKTASGATESTSEKTAKITKTFLQSRLCLKRRRGLFLLEK